MLPRVLFVVPARGCVISCMPSSSLSSRPVSQLAEATTTKPNLNGKNSGGDGRLQRPHQLGERRRDAVIRLKVITCGDQGVGKSCVLKRFCEDVFYPHCTPTIGVDFGVKAMRVGKHEVRICMFDLAGAPDFVEVRNEFYKDSQGVLLAYDTTRRSTFDALTVWMGERARFSNKRSLRDGVVILAANKCDRVDREVTEHEGRSFASLHGLLYHEVSAASGEGIAELFASLLSRILETAPGVPDGCACAAREQLLGAGRPGGTPTQYFRKPSSANARRR